MAKALQITYRRSITEKEYKTIRDKIKGIEKKILPDHINQYPVRVRRHNSIVTAIFNPLDSIDYDSGNLCMGYTNDADWENLERIPSNIEGTYALFRHNENKAQLVTDVVGTRSVWYYFDNEKLISSTSQLAIIYYLGSFEFNENVIPWVLTSGTLGPFLSWDKRLKLLQPNSVLTVNKDSWNFNLDVIPVTFKENDKTIDYKQQLFEALSECFKSHRFDTDKWILPLSGGYDSRGLLLLLLKNEQTLDTITWGQEEAQYEKNNDAYIARELAEHFRLNHSYVFTNKTEESIEKIFRRFLINGEGRVDHIDGYLDGFDIWKNLFENEITGILRGDEGFGWDRVLNEDQVWASTGLLTSKNFKNVSSILKTLKIQHSGVELYEQRPSESIGQWRDRVYHSFRIPIILAALNDLKLSYVEIVNPLLFHSILEVVYTMPDNLRTEKRAFKSIVKDLSPKIGYASKGANESAKDFLKRKPVVKYLQKELINHNTIFPKSIIDNIIREMMITESDVQLGVKSRVKNKFIDSIPKSIRLWMKSNVKGLNNLDPNILAFRIFIIIKMEAMINENLSNK